VLISAFAFGGVPAGAAKKAFGAYTICLSHALLQEYREVPSNLFEAERISGLQFRSLIAGMASFVTKAKIVTPHKKIALCRDPEDNMILECCAAARAEILLTSDKDLLELACLPFRLTILTPRQFVDLALPDDPKKKRL
jgi:uncharacterized protein